jgi:hypothetical protein
MQRLHSSGINPADLMDPHRRSALPEQTVRSASSMIAAGLTWVFVGMLLFAVAQAVATLLMPNKKADHAISRTEALEAVAG